MAARAAIEVNTWVGSGVSKIGDYRRLCTDLKPFVSRAFVFFFYCEVADETIIKYKTQFKNFEFDDVFFLKRYHRKDDTGEFLEKELFRFVNTMRSL